MSGNRVAYHIIQSFSPLDKITPKQANEIGKRVCEELYPDYQCVISTHIDRGHIHNHIVVNAINLHGKKLEDRLSNSKEGLYGLSNVSDRISSEYGCFVMPKRTFRKTKNKDYYYQYKAKTWRSKIKEDIETIINKCSNMEELFEELSLYGYEIKKGKHISVKCIGMKKFIRLESISSKYSSQNLYNYFRKHRQIIISGIKAKETELNSSILESTKESKVAIEKSQMSTEGAKYNEYQKTRYLELKRFYRLKEQLEFLDKHNINSFESLENEIEKVREKIKEQNVWLKENKKKDGNIIEKTEKAQDYIRLKKIYDYATSYKKIDKNYKMPTEVTIFLKIQEELKIDSVEKAKKLIKYYREQRIKINEKKSELLELQKQLTRLDAIKEEKLKSSKLFIHNIKFGGNRINYKLSTDDTFCIKLPYTHDVIYIPKKYTLYKITLYARCIYIPKKYTTYNSKRGFYTLYLVDDKKYELFNEDNQKTRELTGIGLENYVLNKKKEIDMSHS